MSKKPAVWSRIVDKGKQLAVIKRLVAKGADVNADSMVHAKPPPRPAEPIPPRRRFARPSHPRQAVAGDTAFA
jgi:hypothetical protein